MTMMMRNVLVILLCVLGAPLLHANEPHFQIMLEDVEKAVAEAIAAQTELDMAEVTITSERTKVMHADYQPIHVEVATLNIDEARKQWSANLLVKHEADVLTARPISGRYEAQVAVPVLNSRVKHGMVITEDDVVMDSVASAKVRANTVTDINMLVGKTAKQSISPHRAIRIDELESPKIIEIGNTVAMRYTTAYMSINAVGEALQEGGIGDIIRVRNHDSNKVINARVISKDEVDAGI
jgi:flagellar basal body P-ring formation protein FlgA